MFYKPIYKKLLNLYYDDHQTLKTLLFFIVSPFGLKTSLRYQFIHATRIFLLFFIVLIVLRVDLKLDVTVLEPLSAVCIIK